MKAKHIALIGLIAVTVIAIAVIFIVSRVSFQG